MTSVRVVYGEYSDKQDFNLFGYTYIKAEPTPSSDSKPEKNSTTEENRYTAKQK